ncbi:MAG: bifunctional heptose 7-phosphate kinase/heptose 1-phosphate adenyltransferase [Planctomycetota bacterium]|jgi:rfaE bifunctional protein kinase chain/domain
MNPSLSTTLRTITGRLQEARVAVVGDMIADRYVYGRPVKLSREAPVIVMKFEEERVVPGSAANTVNNLRTLGAQVFAVGVVGKDDLGESLAGLLRSTGVDTSGLAFADCETVEKTRILAGGLHTVKQQVIRIDRDRNFTPDPASEETVCEALRTLPGNCNVLVVSDYGYRTVTDRARETILGLRDRMELVVDSHDRLAEFPGAWMVTPNEGEAERTTGKAILSEGDALSAGRILRETLSAEHVLLTRGNQGMVLFSSEGEISIPIFGTEEITDVSGAGDTVVALLAAARSVGAKGEEAARLANCAAGVVVMKRGTATCSRSELEEALAQIPG